MTNQTDEAAWQESTTDSVPFLIKEILEALKAELAKYRQELEAWEWLAAHPEQSVGIVNYANGIRWAVLPAMNQVSLDRLPKHPRDAVLAAKAGGETK